MEEIQQIAKDIRKTIYKIAHYAGGGHMGAAFSIADIITVLYFGSVLRYDVANPEWEDRDRFVLSKGHACYALYAVLAKAGFFSENELWSVGKPGSRLGGHPKLHEIPGVEASTGALGHGLSFAIGIAYANKVDDRRSHTYVILGDGECQEGSVWEAALFISQHKLNNLTLIIDNNRIQATGKTEDILNVESLVDKWRAFGFDTVSVNGHDFEALESGINICKNAEKPAVLIANTIKGKGVSYIENHEHWHYRMPEKEEESVGRKQLGFGE